MSIISFIDIYCRPYGAKNAMLNKLSSMGAPVACRSTHHFLIRIKLGIPQAVKMS